MIETGQLLVLERDFVYIKPWDDVDNTTFPELDDHLQASFEALDDDSEVLRHGDVILFIKSIDKIDSNRHKVKYVFLWKEKTWVTLDWFPKEFELWEVKSS